jgi:uroporphyrin-3 C-methyltransferase
MNEENSSIEPDEANAPPESGEAPAHRLRSIGQVISRMASWLALAMSILALAAVALDYLRDRSAAGDTAESNVQLQTLTASIAATQDTLATVEQSVSALSELDAERSSAIENIDHQLNDRLRQIEAMPGRLAAVEASMATLRGISTGARDAWLLAEAEYYMQIANAQLQLAGNPQLAGLALTHADERIIQLADPRLTGVRQALSDELRALDVLEKPDIAGITLTLSSLAGVVDSMPLRQEVVVHEDSAATTIDPEITGMDRAMASVRNAVSGIVSVRRTDEAMEPLIAPEAQYFLRANLALQLQAARLAVLRGEEAVFRRSLDDANAWIEEYYDPDSNAVRNARETIAEIRSSVFNVAMPDISQSLRLLRQFNAMNQAVSEAEADGPAQ